MQALTDAVTTARSVAATSAAAFRKDAPVLAARSRSVATAAASAALRAFGSTSGANVGGSGGASTAGAKKNAAAKASPQVRCYYDQHICDDAIHFRSS